MKVLLGPKDWLEVYSPDGAGARIVPAGVQEPERTLVWEPSGNDWHFRIGTADGRSGLIAGSPEMPMVVIPTAPGSRKYPMSIEVWPLLESAVKPLPGRRGPIAFLVTRGERGSFHGR